MKDKQNLLLGCIGGIVAVLAAIVWVVITAVTKYQIGWMAIGAGLRVGIAVRLLGKAIVKS